MTTETETTGAAGTPKRRRTARKPADAVASATATPRARARRTTAEDPPSASGTVASPTRSTRSRTRRAAPAAAPETVTPESGLAPETPAADPTEAGAVAEAELASATTLPDGHTPEAQTGEPAETSSAAEESAGRLADPAQGITAPESASGLDSPAAAPEASGQIVAAPEHASPVQRVDFPGSEVRHPGMSRPARPTFKQSVLRAAEERFVGDRVREPVTAQQVDEMLVLLHRPEQIRSLKDATYDFLRRGMSKRHAEVQLEKLRAAVDPARERAAA